MFDSFNVKVLAKDIINNSVVRLVRANISTFVLIFNSDHR